MRSRWAKAVSVIASAFHGSQLKPIDFDGNSSMMAFNSMQVAIFCEGSILDNQPYLCAFRHWKQFFHGPHNISGYAAAGLAARAPVKTRILSTPKTCAAVTARARSSLRRSQRLMSESHWNFSRLVFRSDTFTLAAASAAAWRFNSASGRNVNSCLVPLKPVPGTLRSSTH